MGRTVEKISEGESFEVDYLSRNYQSGQPVVAFKVSGDIAGAGQVQMAAAPSVAGVVQATASGYMQTVFTGLSAPGAVTLTGAKVGDTVVSVVNLTTPANASTDFETKISVAGQIQQTAGGDLSASKFLVLIVHQS